MRQTAMKTTLLAALSLALLSMIGCAGIDPYPQGGDIAPEYGVLDIDDDGFLSEEEFAAGFDDREFGAFDRDGDGLLSDEEFMLVQL